MLVCGGLCIVLGLFSFLLLLIGLLLFLLVGAVSLCLFLCLLYVSLFLCLFVDFCVIHGLVMVGGLLVWSVC